MGHRVAYITVTENAIKWWVTVHGLNHHETRLLAEKVSDQPESHDDKEKVVEFSIPSWQVMTGFVIDLQTEVIRRCAKISQLQRRPLLDTSYSHITKLGPRF